MDEHREHPPRSDITERTHHEREFTAFFHAHFAAIRARAAHRTRNNSRTEDICADVFTLAHHRFDELRAMPERQARAWLLRASELIGNNLTRSAIRRERLITRLEREPLPTQPPPEEIADAAHREAAQQMLRRRGEQVLERLDPKHRSLLQLADYEGRTGREIASELGVTPRAARLRLMRARRAFRDTYVDLFGTDDPRAPR